jgi:hypothetical protein
LITEFTFVGDRVTPPQLQLPDLLREEAVDGVVAPGRNFIVHFCGFQDQARIVSAVSLKSSSHNSMAHSGLKCVKSGFKSE